MLPHAPGVQMADIPEDSVDLGKEKEAEDEGGEADKEKRLGVKIMDKRVEPDNEFESGEKHGLTSLGAPLLTDTPSFLTLEIDSYISGKSGNKNAVNHGETNGAEPMETDNGAAGDA